MNSCKESELSRQFFARQKDRQLFAQQPYTNSAAFAGGWRIMLLSEMLETRVVSMGKLDELENSHLAGASEKVWM